MTAFLGSHSFPCRSLLLSTSILNDNSYIHDIMFAALGFWILEYQLVAYVASDVSDHAGTNKFDSTKGQVRRDLLYNRLYTPDARNYIIYEHLLLGELFELL